MRRLWNEGWRFALLPADSRYEDLDEAALQPVTLPHDWLIADVTDLYRAGDGWYVKSLFHDPADPPETWLSFDGVYFDADVLLNGSVLKTHRYGYTAFSVDLSASLRPGENRIAVHVRYRSPCSRWYSGAGIYRDVHLLQLPARHLVPDSLRVRTVREAGCWLLKASVEWTGGGADPLLQLQDAGGSLLAESVMSGGCCSLRLSGVRPWEPGDPALYTLRIALDEHVEQYRIGFRETAFDPRHGFLLNGKSLKLHGVCLHHDLGCLGAAFHAKAARRQLLLMRDMGANAIRFAHNPPARQMLDLCDELGLLAIDELYDMWELPKTPFDNARFFEETWREDVASWVRRDRTHPCVVLWSIGNEIPDMHVSGRGQEWTRRLTEEVRLHDDGHAAVTFGSNYMPWEGAQACAEIVGVPGYNYAEKYYAAHHKAHPDWVIYGSETASVVQSRGVYHFPKGENILTDEDRQCSALMNSLTSWGTQDLPAMLVSDRHTPYSMGQFIWSGTDYIGEPTPYHTRCSYFGQADTAGFPKDSYYLYQSMWTDRPMIHIGVSWDWNEGQRIDVPVMTNAAQAELFLNGVSLGRKTVDRDDPRACLPYWQVPFHRGVLLAKAYDAGGSLLCEHSRYTPGEPVSVRLSRDDETLYAGCGDIAFITVSAADADGLPVENAVNRIHLAVSGPGVLLGMDNGDSTDTDPLQTSSKRLFSGKLLAMVGIQGAGEVCVSAGSPGLSSASLVFQAQPGSSAERRSFPELRLSGSTEDAILPRRIDLTPVSGCRLSPDQPELLFRIAVQPPVIPPEALSLRMANAAGVTLPWASAELQPDGLIHVRSKADGILYLRASDPVRNGHCRIISQYEMTAEGFGAAGLDPYSFLPAALTDIRLGGITPGNEQGISFARDGFSAAGYSGVDFGPVGSDEITLPIFALDGTAYTLTLWDGIPEQGGAVIARLPYQKPCRWNVYQPETYRLPYPLTGIHTLCFSMDRKIQLRGMQFTRQSRIFRRLAAGDADEVYGDSFRRDGDAVRDIGNNVTLRFDHMDFGSRRQMVLAITGRTPLKQNAVNLRIAGPDGETVSYMCAFCHADVSETQCFTVPVLPGECQVSLVFLPGSRFDLESIRFMEA